VGPLDGLTRRFGRLREHLRRRGYDVEVGATRVFLLERRGVSLPIDLAVARCTTFAGIGGGGVRQLALAVYDGEGREVAADRSEGEGGLTHLCPQPRPGSPTLATVPHHLVVRSLEGAGASIVGAFETLPGRGEGFDGLFDGLLAPQVPFPDLEARLAGRRTVLRERGFLPLGEPHLEPVAEGEAIALNITLSAGRCYVVMARGGRGLLDVDLTVLDPAGAEVAQDHDQDAEPEVELCPAEGGRFGVRGTAFEGAGAVGILVLEGPPEADTADIVEPASTTAPSEGGEDDAPLPTDPVVGLSRLTTALEARGYGAPSWVVTDGWVARGEVRSHEIVLGPGCFVVLGAAARAETDLDLYLTEHGRVIDRDTGVSPAARVRFCPTSAATVRVTVKTYGRGGAYAIASVRAPASLEDVRGLRLEEATADLRGRGFTAAPSADRELVQGEPERLPISIPAGRCAALAVAAGEGMTDVDLFLRDGEGRLLASSSGPEAYAVVTRCAEDEGEDLVAEIVAYRGSGVVVVQRLSGTP
jgi:hypothetical protein